MTSFGNIRHCLATTAIFFYRTFNRFATTIFDANDNAFERLDFFKSRLPLFYSWIAFFTKFTIKKSNEKG